jgi:hypothetical protein
MPVPLKPPRGAFISSVVIYDSKMRPTLKDTLIQLLGLAWRNNGVSTPPLTFNQLAILTGKSINTLYGHIAVLRETHSALRMQDAGDGMVIITFADWVKPVEGNAPPDSEYSELPVKEEEELIHINSIDEHILLNDQGEKPPITKMHPKHKKAAFPKNNLSKGLQQLLMESCVFPSLLPEVSGSGRSEKEIEALMAWAQATQPLNPAPLFMVRLRAGAKPPRAFFDGACEKCGQIGTHLPECPARYLDDPYADAIK